MRRRRRTSQAGQVVVITALMGTVILGGMALTVDLSLHTFNQRTLQNVADAAALSGATDLQRVPNAAQQQLGVTSALSTIQQNQNFPPGWTGASTATTCTIGTLGGLCETVNYLNYTVKISTPPQTAKAPTNVTLNDFEVDMSVNVSNNFGAFVGAATSTVGARAVAYHSGPPSPYGYTFFAATQTDSGNSLETVTGDAYVGAGYNPQAATGGGHSGLCVYQVPEATNDTDGDADGGGTEPDLDDQGHVVFSAPVPSIGIEPAYSQSAAPCTTTGFNVQASQPLASGTNCPLGSAPGGDPGQPGGYNCFQANPAIPPVALPTCGPGVLAADCHTNVCAQTIDSSSSGIYFVNGNAACVVTLDFSNMSRNGGNIACVSIVLGTGSQVQVGNKKANQYVTSYGYNSGDTLATTAITALSTVKPPITVTAPPSCPGAALTSPTQSYDCVICASPTTGNPIALTNATTGCCSDTLFIGSIFLPGQQIYFNTNQALEDVGSVYCGYWNVQSGYHPNPTVTHDNGATDQQLEILRLVE